MVQIDFYRVEILNFRFLTLIIHFTLFLHYGMDKGFSYVIVDYDTEILSHLVNQFNSVWWKIFHLRKWSETRFE